MNMTMAFRGGMLGTERQSSTAAAVDIEEIAAMAERNSRAVASSHKAMPTSVELSRELQGAISRFKA